MVVTAVRVVTVILIVVSLPVLVLKAVMVVAAAIPMLMVFGAAVLQKLLQAVSARKRQVELAELAELAAEVVQAVQAAKVVVAVRQWLMACMAAVIRLLLPITSVLR